LHMYFPGPAASDCCSPILTSCLGCSQKAPNAQRFGADHYECIKWYIHFGVAQWDHPNPD
jgi:hypothetical protein